MSEFLRAEILARGSVQRSDALPAGWKQALERSKRDLAEGKIVDFFASQDSAEKDFEAALAADKARS
jgi:hypothetical protein